MEVTQPIKLSSKLVIRCHNLNKIIISLYPCVFIPYTKVKPGKNLGETVNLEMKTKKNFLPNELK